MTTSTRRTCLALIVAVMIAACGGSSESTELSEQAMRGLEIANQAGCSACHGTDGRGGGVGPGWAGLTGSTVSLEDGSEVAADAAYIRTAIVDPAAQVRSGYTVMMPQVDLTDGEVDALVAYIEEMR